MMRDEERDQIILTGLLILILWFVLPDLKSVELTDNRLKPRRP